MNVCLHCVRQSVGAHDAKDRERVQTKEDECDFYPAVLEACQQQQLPQPQVFTTPTPNPYPTSSSILSFSHPFTLSLSFASFSLLIFFYSIFISYFFIIPLLPQLMLTLHARPPAARFLCIFLSSQAAYVNIISKTLCSLFAHIRLPR
jgi:hypothetical protein